MERYTIETADLKAVVKAHGAELCSLQDTTGLEYLWQAGPAWPRHAPNLFPIVGRLKDDAVRHNGQTHRMTQHGFARDRVFSWGSRNASACMLSLHDDAETRSMFPFSFRFDVAYGIEKNTLAVTYGVTNTGDTILPAALGAHPAFRWPLKDGIPKDSYSLRFEKDENAGTRRLGGGLLLDERFASPVQNKTLKLEDEVFARDAVIFDRPSSRRVFYGADGSAGLEVSWDDSFTELGLWAKPGADFLCIEPWHGMSSPEGFNGDITEKPGMMLIEPGKSRHMTWRVKISSGGL